MSFEKITTEAINCKRSNVLIPTIKILVLQNLIFRITQARKIEQKASYITTPHHLLVTY